MKNPPALILALCALAPLARAEIDLPAIAPAGFARGVVLKVDGYAKTEDRATLTNFPVLVRVSPAAIPGFDYSDCLFGDGADIRFLDAAGNLLPGEVDEWNENGESLVWVSLPRMTNGTEFAMVYGSGDPGPAPAGDVWERYAVVIHGGDSIANSVAGGPAATAGAADVAAAADAGKVGGGIRKSVANAVGVNVANAASALADTGKFSVSGWFKRDGNGGAGNGTHVLGASRVEWNKGSGFLWLQEQGKYVSVAAPGSHQWSSGAYKLADREWAHVAFAYEKGVSLVSWFNGAQDQARTSPGGLENTSGAWTFGSYQDRASNDSFCGDMDELRVFDGIAPGDWIKAEHDTVSDASFLSAGPVVYFQSTPAPQVGLAAPASGVLFTNVTLAARVGSLGTDAAMANDASWADLLLVVSTNADLSDPLFALSLSRVTAAPASVAVPLAPLATNATYYARLSATNSFGVAGESGVVSFTTRSPGPPSGTGAFLSGGLSRLAASGTVTDFGAGAAAATIRLEASTDSFATVVPSAETNAVLGQAAAFAIDGLDPNTDYALRFRLVNDWGLVAYVPLPETYLTRSGLVGLYTFDRTNPFEAVVGSPAKEGTAGNKNTAVTLSDTISALSVVSDPAVLAGRTGVVSVPSYSTLAIPNPGLQKNWTIALWFYAPETAPYHCFFQFGSPANNGDGSLFIRDGARIGCGDYTDVSGAIGAWHQLVVSSANNTQTVWYDTQKLAQTRSWNIAGMSLLQFSLDNDGEDAPLYFDEIRLYDGSAPEDVFPDGIAAGPVLLDRWTETPYADNWGSFTRAPDRVIESAPYRTYIFSRHGTVSFTPFKSSPESSLLLVGGGGAGGMMRGGGGGAGGVVSATGVTLGAQTYSFSVGAGGAPDIHRSWYVDKQEVDRTLHEGPTTASACGGETTFSDVSGAVLHRAAGGGGGGNFNYLGTQIVADGYGLDGASGGGASCRSTQPGLGIAGQGHDGGEAATDGNTDNSGGGGGGAGGAGAKGTSSVAGAGGNGVTNSITGLPVVYGGGGGASSYTLAGGLAGEGGGGTGVSSAGGRLRSTAANGVNGLGGGGGGGSGQGNSPYNSTGGRGGDGTVILRVLVPEVDDSEPIVAVVADPVGHTNATLTATLVSLGDGASSATVSLVVSANADLSDPVFSGTLAENASIGAFSLPLAPLLTNTIYYARATAANDRGKTGTSSLLSFRTLDPEPAAVGLVPAGTGFGAISATANVASFGAGSTDATVYLDCSLLGDFSDTVSSPGVAVSSLPFTQVLKTAGLVPGTNYFYRVRAVNTWGVEGVSATFEAVTEASPVRLSKIGSTPAADGSQTLSVSTLAVEPGTVYALTISVDGSTVATFANQNATRTFEIPYAGKPGSSHVAVASASALYLGRTYVTTERLAFTLGGNNVIVSDWSGHCSAATAIRVNAGDTIVLPQLRSGWRYRVLNDRFLSMDGLTVTALEPAVAGIEVWNGETLMGTMAILVLPEAIEGGDIYVYDETVSTGNRIWDDAAAWDKIGSATDSQWPCNPNDIAVIPFHATENDAYLRHRTGLSLGGILFGSFRDVAAGCVLERHSSVGTKTISFERTDEEPAFVKVTPNTYSERSNTLRFGGYDLLVECASSVETDACSSPTNSALHQGFVTYSACTIHIPEGRYWAVDGIPGYYINMGPTLWPPSLTGEGVFWKRGMGGLTFGNQPNFHGTLVDSSHGHLGGFNRAAPTFWHDGAGGTNVSVALAGWVSPRLGNPTVSASGYGWFQTGWDPGYGSDGPHPDVPWNPRKTMTLRGGAYYACSTENGGWGKGVRSSRIYEKLAVEAGMSYVGEGERGNNDGHPINYIEWGSIEHGDKGTLVIYDPSRRSVAATASGTNTMTVVLNHGDFLVGHGQDGDCLSTDVYPIIPWIVAPTSSDDSSWQNTMFASFDANGRLTRPIWHDTALDAAASPFSNAYLWDKTIEIGRDVTVNSLFMNNSGKDKWLGEGRTLTISSGGLVLHGSNTSIGQPGRTDNGSLVLGDADRPGYVFAKSSDVTKPNQIWASVTAPGGFVSSYSGALVLGGSQTNILDELVANAGVLSLGTADRGCALAKNLPVRVCAGATLVAPRPDAVKRNLLRFDGAGGQFGRVELPDGVAAQCKKAFWRDYPKTPEWQSLPRGTYGSSDSGVSGEFVRDDLFVGTGTLRVVADDRIPPTIMILR